MCSWNILHLCLRMWLYFLPVYFFPWCLLCLLEAWISACYSTHIPTWSLFSKDSVVVGCHWLSLVVNDISSCSLLFNTTCIWVYVSFHLLPLYSFVQLNSSYGSIRLFVSLDTTFCALRFVSSTGNDKVERLNIYFVVEKERWKDHQKEGKLSDTGRNNKGGMFEKISRAKRVGNIYTHFLAMMSDGKFKSSQTHFPPNTQKPRRE